MLLDKLRQRCVMDFGDFAALPGAELKTGKRGRHIFFDRGSSVLAVAHLDWVKFLEPIFYKDNGNDCIQCPQLDDRLGAWVILDVLPSLGLEFDVLLTDGEERGNSTAADFTQPRQYNWGFEFDRRGVDTVLYRYDSSTEWKNALKESGLTLAWGTFSDICELTDCGVCFANVGTGYWHEHTNECRARLSDTMSQALKFKAFFNTNKERKFAWEKPTYTYTGFYGGNGRWNRRDDEGEDEVASWYGRTWGRHEVGRSNTDSVITAANGRELVQCKRCGTWEWSDELYDEGYCWKCYQGMRQHQLDSAKDDDTVVVKDDEKKVEESKKMECTCCHKPCSSLLYYRSDSKWGYCTECYERAFGSSSKPQGSMVCKRCSKACRSLTYIDGVGLCNDCYTETHRSNAMRCDECGQVVGSIRNNGTSRWLCPSCADKCQSGTSTSSAPVEPKAIAPATAPKPPKKDKGKGKKKIVGFAGSISPEGVDYDSESDLDAVDEERFIDEHDIEVMCNGCGNWIPADELWEQDGGLCEDCMLELEEEREEAEQESVLYTRCNMCGDSVAEDDLWAGDICGDCFGELSEAEQERLEWLWERDHGVPHTSDQGFKLICNGCEEEFPEESMMAGEYCVACFCRLPVSTQIKLQQERNEAMNEVRRKSGIYCPDCGAHLTAWHTSCSYCGWCKPNEYVTD